MPRSKANPPNATRSGNVVFIDPVLSDQAKADLKLWSAELSGEEVLAMLSELVSAHYGVTVKAGEQGGMCSVSPQGDDHKHIGKLLITRASSPIAALRVALYKHFMILKEEWPNASGGGWDL